MILTLTNIRPRRRPTWLGWLLITTLFFVISINLLRNLYPFLAPEAPSNKGLMVVEGWIDDHALEEAITLFRTGNYAQIACTGAKVETGSYLQQFKSYSEMTARRLTEQGVATNNILITVADDAKKDRTYLSAVALRDELQAQHITETNLHLITTGPHGRRSRFLFQKALGPAYTIGITCLPPASYEPKDWYTCSEGVRTVINELIAYGYAKLLFHP